MLFLMLQVFERIVGKHDMYVCKHTILMRIQQNVPMQNVLVCCHYFSSLSYERRRTIHMFLAKFSAKIFYDLEATITKQKRFVQICNSSDLFTFLGRKVSPKVKIPLHSHFYIFFRYKMIIPFLSTKVSTPSGSNSYT